MRPTGRTHERTKRLFHAVLDAEFDDIERGG